MKIIITEVGPLTWTFERYPAEPHTAPDLYAQLTYEAGEPLPEVMWALDLFQPNEVATEPTPIVTNPGEYFDDAEHLTSIHIAEVDGPVDKGPDWNQVMNEVRNYQV